MCNGIEVCKEQIGYHFVGSRTTGLKATWICVWLQDVIYFLLLRTSSEVYKSSPDEFAGCSEPAFRKCSQCKDSK
jgi:hypothetical protein